jgi:hypothetical protein
VEEDASGLTFQEWTTDSDTSRTPVSILINSIKWCAVGFNLKEVFKCFLQHLRQLHVVASAREERDYEVLRVSSTAPTL